MKWELGHFLPQRGMQSKMDQIHWKYMHMDSASNRCKATDVKKSCFKRKNGIFFKATCTISMIKPKCKLNPEEKYFCHRLTLIIKHIFSTLCFSFPQKKTWNSHNHSEFLPLTGWLIKYRKLFLTVLVARKSKTKAKSDSVYDQIVCVIKAFPWALGGGRGQRAPEPLL